MMEAHRDNIEIRNTPENPRSNYIKKSKEESRRRIGGLGKVVSNTAWGMSGAAARTGD